ncbi:hypothetical protein [Virgibacillus chiguensis]|uniref:Uncharacterized protein n=1 Tax=Virgibacillus chiguensis TaxID=411959 RepID=A0A1M5XPM5_9BACI|nr:hypothetical protein [Virgibacillus chiguensis]SHI01488.1 hypothetical protein SAMN05421807_13121 [Virgibacillus chiguensis]
MEGFIISKKKNYFKKLLVSVSAILLVSGLIAPGINAESSKSEAEPIPSFLGDPDHYYNPNEGVKEDKLYGPIKEETIRISNGSLGIYSGGSLALERLVKNRVGKAVLGYAGVAGALVAALNEAKGNNGIEITIYTQRGTTEVFDGAVWVEHTGEHIVGYDVSTY